MAAGAIPPPLFFEHRHHISTPFSLCVQVAFFKRAPKKSISATIRRTVGTLTPARDRSLSKDD